MDQLLSLLGRLLEDPGRLQAKRKEFRSPEFNGQEDVDFFIQQFLEVSETNRWETRAELIHLRASLRGEAQRFGKAADRDGIF